MLWISIVGARPQFVKIATVCRAIAQHNRAGGTPIEDYVVNTGQHYDAGMSNVFFDELDFNPPVSLAIGSGTHGSQTGRMLIAIEKLLLEREPDLVLVYGDTNSTIAGALAATKLGIRVAHIEAGLRSFNRAMPEELNRIAADHLSDVLLAPTPAAMRNLAREGLEHRATWVGDVMLDAVRFGSEAARERSKVLQRNSLEPGSYGVVTIHRAESTLPGRLAGLLDALNDVARTQLPLVFPVHPRTRAVIASELRDWRPAESLRLIEPIGYLDMLALVSGSRVVLTDSGGLQKEAFFLERPCITLRSETEWVETVEAGANIVVGFDQQRIKSAVYASLGRRSRTASAFSKIAPVYGDGAAARKTVALLADYVQRPLKQMQFGG